MNQFFFWREWKASYRIFYLCCLAALALCGGYALYYFFVGFEAVAGWKPDGSLEEVRMPVRTFFKGFFSFTLEAESYVITQRFKPEYDSVDLLPYYLYGGALLLGTVLYLTFVSDLSRYAYMAGIGVFLFFLSRSGVGLLGVWEEVHEQAFLALMMAYYGGFSLYFNSFNELTHPLLRFGVYAVGTAVFALMAVYLGEAGQPMVYFTTYSLAFPLGMLLAFSFVNAHEIVRGGVYLVTANSDGEEGYRTVLHLSVLLAIYVANLSYSYSYIRAETDWGILFLHPIPMYLLTVGLGIWGFGLRQSQYRLAMAFTPSGAFLYLSLAIMTVALIGFSYATGNEALSEACEDISLYTHIGMTIGFGLYLFQNFFNLMLLNKPVHRVIFQPTSMPFVWALVVAAIAVSALFATTRFFTYRQSVASFRILQGDLARIEGDALAAVERYEQALKKDGRNRRAFYSLGSIARQAGSYFDAVKYFRRATEKRPLPQAYAHLGELFLAQDKYFDAQFVLQEGVARCPHSAELRNELALTFNRTDIKDSVLHHLRAGAAIGERSEALNGNLLAILAKYDLPVDSSYLEQSPLARAKEEPAAAANYLTRLNRRGEIAQVPYDPSLVSDSLLSTEEFCYIYNYALNQLAAQDTTVLPYIRAYADSERFGDFDPFVEYALGLLLYQHGQHRQALARMEPVARQRGGMYGYYPNLLGLMHLELENWSAAAANFRRAANLGEKQAVLNRAIAVAESGEREEAVRLWQQIADGYGGARWRLLGKQMLEYLAPENHPEFEPLSIRTPDEEKYGYLRYNANRLTDEQFEQTVGAFIDSEYKILALAERLERAVRTGDQATATRYARTLSELSGTQGNEALGRALAQFVYFYAELNEEVLAQVEASEVGKARAGWKAAVRARYLAESGDTAAATAAWQAAIDGSPYDALIWREAVEHLRAQGDKETAYALSLEAVDALPNAYPVQESYILCALDQYLVAYAADAMNRLSDLAPEAEYARFYEIYARRVAEIRSEDHGWSGSGGSADE